MQRCVLLAVLAASILSAGCAADQRYSQGVEWIVSQEAEKKRLHDAGFPQYNDGR
jgi:hypothetical protein